MTRPRDSNSLPRGALAVLIALALWGGRGCYNPQISLTPGVQCAPLPAKQCPDGFSCAGTRCVPGGGTGGAGLSGGTGGGVGTGGAGGVCANPIGPLCTSTAGSSPCDPVCQTGCACGLTCGVTSSGFGCGPTVGTKGLGVICQPGTDDCMPGYICQRELCGTNLGRCYRLCNDGSVCGTAGVCLSTTVTPPSGGTATALICSLADTACNAVTGAGCSNAAFNCYSDGGKRTKCDCPGQAAGMEKQLGESCLAYNDCAPGLICLTISSMSTCYKVCSSTADCAGCMILGQAGGYCP